MSSNDHNEATDSTANRGAADDRTMAKAPPGRRFGRSSRRLTKVFDSAVTPIVIATMALFLVSWVVEPASVSSGALLGILPFMAILAIIAMGQTLVVQQGGIDLSVPGMVSFTAIIMTVYPDGQASRLPAALAIAFGGTLLAGLLSGIIVSRLRVTPIVVTLGMNALLYGAVLHTTLSPRPTTTDLANFATSRFIGGIPNTVIIAVALTALVGFTVKKTVVGRRFEAVGAGLFGARAAGLETRRYQLAAYVAAAALYCIGAILLAGVVATPTLFQGDDYLLPPIAAVVLGGTSLLGGRGSVVATAIAAVFLEQLNQFVLVSQAPQGVQLLVNAAALAAGVAIYSVKWRRVVANLRLRSADRRGGDGQNTNVGVQVT
jgi:ribose transport system permease protein